MKEVIFKNEGTIDDTTSLALWFEAIRQANLMNDLSYAVVGCSKDKDGECRRRGCIDGQITAPIFDREKLLKLKVKTLSWLKKHPDFEPEIEKLKEFFYIASLSEIEDEIKKIKFTAVVDEVKDVFNIIAFPRKNEVAMADAFDEINAYPCSREIAVNVSKSELGDKVGYIFVDQFDKVRMTKNILLDWYYAKDNQEVIKKMQEESWGKSLSEKEVLKRGIKLASIEE